MRLILTHEQADFDALASMLGASLLDDDALPVLPRKMNRNVRSFITLYGAELPFVDACDLSPNHIEAVTLVDTQSLVTIKGMGAGTKVRVVDHHPPRKSLPRDWEVVSEQIGATTTILTEAIEAHNESLDAIQATLLLLGIYEDTGSLTYASTTPRDIRAAAHLVDQGASLQIAANYLNPPLSAEQRLIYDRLVAEAQTHNIHGHRIIVTCGEAGEASEEISSLAHKLRDLLDPDAIFVLVSTVEGVRMVARSTTDGIDVAAIAAHFGGGGHERAAAALIKRSPLPVGEGTDGNVYSTRLLMEETQHGQVTAPLPVGEGSGVRAICQELLNILPRHVRPSVTAAQIMSHRPKVLPPEATLQEAARLMQKYGYEGFPVVKDGRVIGLLTRRAVDRALAHKLNLTAASLMEAGEVTVRPDDSLQYLQGRMTDSGWGQVPVVDPQTHKVVGIVTRTDLLKTLAPKARRATHHNLAEKLEKFLPAECLVLIHTVAEEATAQRLPLYLVGGFVRDLLLDRPSLDFDMVVEGDAIALAGSLAAHYGGKVTTHSRFGTAKWFPAASYPPLSSPHAPRSTLPAQPPTTSSLDLISARQEFYDHPSALPSVERGSIKMDLHRRDFTINTMALRLDGHHYGELLDPWGGYNDLEEGLVRVLHSLSFVDDPTRMLRAVRFEQRFGFSIETHSLQLMAEARSMLEKLSSDRIRHELNLILTEVRAADILARLDELNLLTAIHPSLTWDESLRRELGRDLDQPPPPDWGYLPDLGPVPLRQALGYLLWLSPLSHVKIDSVATRLRIPMLMRRNLKAACELRQDLPELKKAKPSAIFTRLEDVPLLAIYAVYLGSTGKCRQILNDFVVRWRHVRPKTTGNELKSRGLPPGRIYQNILKRLRDAWLDGEITTVAEEQTLLEDMLKSA
jgi:tRNA nucleotidyltransferase (CCA-adding enzyme)